MSTAHSYKRVSATYRLSLQVLALMVCSNPMQGQLVMANRGDLVRVYVRSVSNETDYNVMMYKDGQKYAARLWDYTHKLVKIAGETYNVWVFKCGTFKNEGDRGWNNWAFSGPCWYTEETGSKVYFQHHDCNDVSLQSMADCGSKTRRRR